MLSSFKNVLINILETAKLCIVRIDSFESEVHGFLSISRLHINIEVVDYQLSKCQQCPGVVGFIFFA